MWDVGAYVPSRPTWKHLRVAKMCSHVFHVDKALRSCCGTKISHKLKCVILPTSWMSAFLGLPIARPDESVCVCAEIVTPWKRTNGAMGTVKANQSVWKSSRDTV